MNRLIVFEMNKEYKCISTPLNLGVMQVNVFLKHMEIYGHNFDQYVEITENILEGLKTIKFDYYDDIWNKKAEESLRNFTLENFLVSIVVSPFQDSNWEIISEICEEIKKYALTHKQL